MKRTLLKIILLLLAFSPAVAEEEQERLMKERLRQMFPDVDITAINATPLNGIYEVVSGIELFYMSADTRFVINGDLIDIQEKRNLSEDVRAQSRTVLLGQIPENEYIEFAPENSRNIVYVFTDVDCGYCRKLHADVPELNSNEIAVRYLAYPRNGARSAAYRQMTNVWCAEDRPQALTDAKRGMAISSADCAHPVDKQYELGIAMGVRGTPAIFLEDGSTLPGYVPPDELLKVLGR